MLNTFYDKYIFTNGLKYRDNNFYLLNLPFVIAPSMLFTALQEVNEPDFSRRLYYAVKDSVKKRLVKEFGLGFGFQGEKLVQFLEAYFVASGWGSIKTVDLDFENKQAIVKVKNSPFSSRLHKKVSRPCDHFLRGILAGLFCRVFNADVDCVEVHCIALGEQDCEFIIKKQGSFNLENKHVREQIELDI
jgi:predicted hydrocarbon binding protein